MISLTTLFFFIYGSYLYGWLAVAMANGSRVPPAPEINDPEQQARTGLALFMVFFLLSVMYGVFAGKLPPVTAQIVDISFSILMIAAVFFAAVKHGDSLFSVGITNVNFHYAILFLVPIAAVVLFPGGAANWKFLAGAVTPGIVVTGIALEILFRGYLQTRFQAAWGVRNGLLGAATLATLYQAPMYIFSGYRLELLIALPLYFIVHGCVSGFIFNRMRNIYGLVILNVLMDTAAIVYMGMSFN